MGGKGSYENSSGCYGCDDGIGFLIVIILLIVAVIGFVFARCVGKKAERNGHSFALWAVLGFFFGLVALLALHIAITAEDNGHNFTVWAVFGFIFTVGALIMLETGLIAERKLYDFTSYCIIGALFGIFAILVACFLPKIVVEKITIENSVEKITIKNPVEKHEEKPSYLMKSYNATNVQTNKHWKCDKCDQLNVPAAKYCINCYSEKPKN